MSPCVLGTQLGTAELKRRTGFKNDFESGDTKLQEESEIKESAKQGSSKESIRKEESEMADVKEKGAPAPETTAVPSATAVNAATASKKGPGLSFRRFFTKAGVSPYDEIEWELRTASDHRRQGQRHLRAERCRSPQRLVDDRHQYRGQQISARHARHARARDRRARHW